jgi:hypothetical protein
MAHQLKMESVIHDAGQVPHSTTLVTGVPDSRLPVAVLEHKLAVFLRGAGYPVVRVAVELREVDGE